MKRIISTLILSIITATAFVFFVRADVLRKLPGFHCEGFGCAGLGIVYLLLALTVIPLVFGAVGYFSSKEERLKQTLLSVVISFVLMFMSLVAIYVWNQIDIQRATQEEERVMQELYQRLNIPDHPLFRKHSLFDLPSK